MDGYKSNPTSEKYFNVHERKAPNQRVSCSQNITSIHPKHNTSTGDDEQIRKQTWRTISKHKQFDVNTADTVLCDVLNTLLYQVLNGTWNFILIHTMYTQL